MHNWHSGINTHTPTTQCGQAGTYTFATNLGWGRLLGGLLSLLIALVGFVGMVAAQEPFHLSDETEGLTMTLHPHWWETGWFYGVVGLLLVILFLVIRMRRMQQRQQKLEQEFVLQAKALHKREIELERVQELVGFGIGYYHFATAEYFRSKHMSRMYGFGDEAQQVSRETMENLFHPDDIPLLFQSVQDIIDGKVSQANLEVRFFLADGSLRYGQEIFVILFDDQGKPESLFAVMLDITEQKRVEQELEQARERAEAANRAKSIFLANMSHELRTPLNAILGFAQLLYHNESSPAEQSDMAGIIYRSGTYLLSLINNVLSLSKIEAGRFTLNKKLCAIHTMVHEVETMFALRAKEKHLSFVVSIAPDVPHIINTDEVKLRQVLINLLSNAIKFTNEGTVTLLVERDDAEQHAIHDSIRFTIADTGPGIAADEMEYLFESFSQTSTGHLMQEGTGLGLAISRSFVQMLGGDIHVASEVGKGTTMTFSIQSQQGDQEAETPHHQPVRQRAIGLVPGQPIYRILIADDHPESRLLLYKLFVSCGFPVREASNGQEAVACWEEWKPHIIWMDMRMPVMDGYEATRTIKAQPGGQETIIIACTASAFEEDRDKLLAAGCDDVVAKPIEAPVLFDKMVEFLGVQFFYAEESVPIDQPHLAVPPAHHASPPHDMIETPSYEESARTDQTHLAMTSAQLASLPRDTLEKIYYATYIGDMRELAKIIEEIDRHYDTQLAQELYYVIKQFRADIIVDMLKEIMEHKQHDA